ncbi:peptidoglycan-binding domain-containing protein [Thomasclavelia cocleata]|uniref:C40 family peptidase n=1 Tax=Thomasclavelia cocleata TaxID=69824 RepID=UPI00242D758A|nr:peptidoglycan-binding protein [Thomasclavelia cocleata]
MTVLTNKQLVEKAKSVANSATIYKLGTFGNKTINGKRQWDCSGLLKGILWEYPENGKYESNGVLDQNADTIISKCLNVSSDFSNIIPGEIVWIKGHMGIYIGDGKIIEATPKWDNGVQISTCANIASGLKNRKWTKHGKSPYINYGATTVTPTPQPAPKPSGDNWVKRLQEELNSQFGAGLVVDGIKGPKTLSACPTVKINARGNVTKLIQERLNSVGFNLTVDGIFGDNTKKAVKVFQKNRGLTVDGIVGANTWEWLLKGTKM